MSQAVQNELRVSPTADRRNLASFRLRQDRLDALALFRRAVACPEVVATKAALGALGRALGPARDWDVFIDGTGAAVAAARGVDVDEIAELTRANAARVFGVER